MKIYLNAPHFENLQKELEDKLHLGLPLIEWTLSAVDSDINIYDQSSWHEALVSDKNILLSSEEDEFNIIDLLLMKPCHHLIGFSRDFLSEILTTVQLITSCHLWNVEETYGEFDQKDSLSLTSSEEIKLKLKPLLEKINFENQFNSSFNVVYLLSNELLMNAFFHHKNVRSLRTENVSLDTPVEFEIRVNSRGILFKVKDTNGGFPYEKIVSSLSRGFKEKAPRAQATVKEGAGLGLNFVYKMANQVIFNVTEGEGTEIICLIESSKRYKQYLQRVTSLHYNKRIK